MLYRRFMNIFKDKKGIYKTRINDIKKIKRNRIEY